MAEITIDQALREKLNGLNEEIAFRDEAGRTVGHFVPEEQYRAMIRALMNTCPFSDEELERRSKETGGRPLAEFWNELGVK